MPSWLTKEDPVANGLVTVINREDTRTSLACSPCSLPLLRARNSAERLFCLALATANHLTFCYAGLNTSDVSSISLQRAPCLFLLFIPTPTTVASSYNQISFLPFVPALLTCLFFLFFFFSSKQCSICSAGVGSDRMTTWQTYTTKVLLAKFFSWRP